MDGHFCLVIFLFHGGFFVVWCGVLGGLFFVVVGFVFFVCGFVVFCCCWFFFFPTNPFRKPLPKKNPPNNLYRVFPPFLFVSGKV